MTQSTPELLSIETPENLPLEAPLAGFASRCTAAFIDYLIIGVLLAALGAVALARGFDARGDRFLIAAYIALQFLIITFYHLLFEIGWNGQSPGKRWLGLRVVRTDGLPLTVTGAVIRNFMRLFDFLPIGYGVGLITLFVTRRSQRLGDLAAGTLVIREGKAVTLDSLRETTRVQYLHLTPYSPLPDYIRIDGLTETDRQRILEFLNRRDALRDKRQLAWLLARDMATKMGLPTQSIDSQREPRTAEIFLEQIMRAFEVHDAANRS